MPGDAEPSADVQLARLAERVTALEELLTHSQHAVDTLSQEMFAQTRRIEAVQQELARLMHKLDTMRDAMPQAPRDLLAEKPPHY
jgi:uncharacterized coiled-coil protein SlyX